jgi:hypothetical protein
MEITLIYFVEIYETLEGARGISYANYLHRIGPTVSEIHGLRVENIIASVALCTFIVMCDPNYCI